MFSNRSLAFKYSFYILFCVIAIGLVIFWRNHRVTRAMMLKNVEENARNLCEATAYKIDQPFVVAAAQANEMAGVIENTRLTDAEIKKLMVNYLNNSDHNIFGGAIAFEPFQFDPSRRFYAPYVYRDGRETKFMYLGNDNYLYFLMDWYHIPKELQRPVWSEPYFDDGGGNVIMTTYSSPFYRVRDGKRIFEGVVTNDISLSRLQKLVSSTKLYNSGYGYLISRFGRIISHPNVAMIMNQTIFSVAEERNRPELKTLGLRMTRGESGFTPYYSETLGRKCWICYMPLKSTGWSLAVVIPEDELFADLDNLNRNIIIIWLVGLAILLAVIIMISLRVTHPLKMLTAATEEIGKGNFHQKIPLSGGSDEIGILGNAFNRMQQALDEHIEILKQTTAEKEKIESELKIAKEIQMSIIPKFFPPFPDRSEINVFAVLESAKAVGGDLYDFFFLDEKRICFAIGDVSGKGVPASLFMAVTQTLLKATAEKSLSAGAIVSRINRALSKDNDMSMFVTYFLAIVNIYTGEVEFCNAGHNPPFILRHDGTIEKIKKLHGPPMGIMEGTVYESEHFQLAPGEGILMYTDGVTEAMNSRNQEYGEAKLLELLRSQRDEKARALVETILGSVRVHAGGAEQSDDITILALRYFGPGGDDSLRVEKG